MTDDKDIERKEIQCQWEFAAIVQFLTTFGPPLFKLEEFETQVLEDALLRKSSSYFLTNIIVQLMRCLTDNRNINESTMLQYLKRIFTERFQDDSIFKDEDYDKFWELNPRVKILGLHRLCEGLLEDADKFRIKMKPDTAEDEEYWRVEPIGYDAQENTYWLFDDNRLYIERVEREGEDPTWEPVCITLEDWKNFANKFQGSKNRYEKSLHKALTDDIVPKVVADLQEKQKQRELEEAIRNRKRSSRLVVRDLERMEQERQEELRRRENQGYAEERRDRIKERREEIERRKAEEERERRQREREERVRKREEAMAWQRQQEELRLAKEESIRLTKERMEKKKKESWMFRCYCGVKGKNLDDGKPMLCCEQCQDWLHISCVDQRLLKKKGQKPRDWTVDDYVCDRCVRNDKKRQRKESQTSEDQIIDVIGNDDQPKKPKIKLILSHQAPAHPATTTNTNSAAPVSQLQHKLPQAQPQQQPQMFHPQQMQRPIILSPQQQQHLNFMMRPQMMQFYFPQRPPAAMMFQQQSPQPQQPFWAIPTRPQPHQQQFQQPISATNNNSNVNNSNNPQPKESQ